MKHYTIAGRITAATFTLIFMLATILSGCAAAPATATSAQTAAPAESAEVVVPSATQQKTAEPASNAEGVGYISLDVNPSIQLAIKGGVVLGVTAFNDDGTEIAVNYNVAGMTYENAVDKLIGALATEGYLAPADTKPSIVITAYGDVEEDLITDIETQAQESLTALGLDCLIYASDVSDEMAVIAKSYGLTPGRFLLLSYLADSEGISMEDAIAKYADKRMGDLTHLVGEALGVYGDLSPLLGGLTDEQIAVLTAAKEAYATAMHAAAQAHREAKAVAIDTFKAAKEAAQQAFKDTKDKNAWKQSKTAAQQAFQQAKKDGKAMFEAAKAKARGDFMAAVAALGLDPEFIENLLAWEFDLNWDSGSWGDAPEEPGEAQPDNDKDNNDKDSKGKDSKGKDSKDNDAGNDDAGNDDADDDDDKNDGGNGGGNGGKPDDSGKPDKADKGKR